MPQSPFNKSNPKQTPLLLSDNITPIWELSFFLLSQILNHLRSEPKSLVISDFSTGERESPDASALG
jgi:hypothetical protein